ncbi:MAG: ATP-dependent zinc metalloprotease FtsH [bacterium]
MNDRPPGRDPEKRVVMGGGRPGKWRPLIWIALAWLLVIYWMGGRQGHHRFSISYTEFKEQVQGNNVSEVVVKADRITGKFKKPVKKEDDGDSHTASSGELAFATVKPPFSDPELMQLLETEQVTIRAEPQENFSWLGLVLVGLLPWVLIIGTFVYLSRMGAGGGGGMIGNELFGIGKSKAKRYRRSLADQTYRDVAGLENAKKDLMEVIQYLRDPQRFAFLGARPPKGVLLVGPPGTGKTLLARATAGEAEVSFFSVSGSEFIEMFVGVGASRVRDLFETAKREAPAIIFVDELDSVGRARGTSLGSGHDEREQTLNQILSEMDGFEPANTVVVMAATNRPEILDPALTRPGRFDRQVVLDLPHKEARREILRIQTRNVPVAAEVDLSHLASRTVGFSGADLTNLVNEAAMLAGRKMKRMVQLDDFEQARDKILLGNVREEALSMDEKEIVAMHEAGHALVARMLPDTDPLEKVTIIPRGRSLGVTEQFQERERHHLSRRYLFSRVAVMLGGRAAEKLLFGDVTNGAQDDLRQATRLVRAMVCKWGMSERLGPVAFQDGEESAFLGLDGVQQRDFSEHTCRLIDAEIKRIIVEMEERAWVILRANRDKLVRLANALLEEETLDTGKIDEILNLEESCPSEQQAAAGGAD